MRPAAIPLGLKLPTGSSHLPASLGPSRPSVGTCIPTALAYLVLLRMEVAAFHPRRTCIRRDSSLWPSSSRRRARELPCIPLCGARTFLCAFASATAAAWPTPPGILGPEPALVVVKGGVLALVPARVAEDGQRREQARRRVGRLRGEPLRRQRVNLAAGEDHRLAGDARPRLERLLEHRVAEDDDAHRLLYPLPVLPKKLLPFRGAQERQQFLVAAQYDRPTLVEDRQQVAQRPAASRLLRQL